MEAATPQRPIRLVVRDDDLTRSRLTVFFRLILAIPHYVWLVLWGIAAFTVAFVLWLAIVINGKVPTGLHDFVAGYLRYAIHVSAYLFIAANPYPGFRGRPGYPVDLEIEAPERQSRWSGLFRLILALPALVLAGVLSGSGGRNTSGVAPIAAVFTWVVSVVRGQAPRGLRDLVLYSLGYGAQAAGYLLLLTGRYPSSDPKLVEPFADLPEHPVRISVTDELERSRLTVLFRLLIAIPHLVWFLLWTIAVFVAVVIGWIVALATGRLPTAFKRFFGAYVRYTVHVFAFVHVVGRRFPGFTGEAGSYGIDLELDLAERQSRWKTLFRLLLALPAFAIASSLGGALVVVAVLGWVYALVKGRMPEGLRNLGAVCLRYQGQTWAYLLLLTDRYPYGAPVLTPRRAPEPAPEPGVVPGDAF